MSEALRLFFALPVPAPLARRIGDWRQRLSCPGAWVDEQDLHLTLAFLGSQPATRLPALRKAAAQLRDVRPFELRLDRLGLWHDGLLHLAPDHVPGALLQLQQGLCERLSRIGLDLEPRTYRPHLTLARHVPGVAGTTPFDFAWRVDSFALFSSKSQTMVPRYQQIGTWHLA